MNVERTENWTTFRDGYKATYVMEVEPGEQVLCSTQIAESLGFGPYPEGHTAIDPTGYRRPGNVYVPYEELAAAMIRDGFTKEEASHE